MALPQRDNCIDEITKTYALLEYVAQQGDEVDAMTHGERTTNAEKITRSKQEEEVIQS